MHYDIEGTLKRGDIDVPPHNQEFEIKRLAFDEGMRDDIVAALNTLSADRIIVTKRESRRAGA